MRKPRLRYPRVAAAATAAAIGLAGCIPLKEVREGAEIASQDLAWVKLGETDRAAIRARLGEPDVDFVDRRTIAYGWSGRWGLLCGYNCVELEMSRALMIRFDAADRIAAFAIVDRPTSAPRYNVHERRDTGEATGWTAVIEDWLPKSGLRSDSGR